MPLFRALVFSSVLVGLIVGVVVTLAQLYATVPLILKAETYEKSSEASIPAPGPAAPQVQAPGQAQVPAHDHSGHDHVAAAWEPADGLERTLYTAGANILNATGFALLLAGAFSLRRTGVTWREGLLWGLAGFAAFTVAPGLGLPPELPGVPAADLNARQIWWVGTAAATLLGLGLIAFVRAPIAAAAGVGVLLLPHVIGAPHVADASTSVPEALSRQFVVAVTLTSLISWALLGSLTGVFYRKFSS